MSGGNGANATVETLTTDFALLERESQRSVNWLNMFHKIGL